MKEAHYRPLKIDEYEIDPSCIKLGIQIGKGAYGRVHLATADGLLGASDQSTVVAVKLMKSDSTIQYNRINRLYQILKICLLQT